MFMLSVRISSYGCTREVWRAREKRQNPEKDYLAMTRQDEDEIAFQIISNDISLVIS